MRYFALATDFDGTLAHDARVAPQTVDALRALKKSGRFAILVTGRLLDSLANDFAELELFDLIVAENGGLLYDPKTKERISLAQSPPARFAQTLRRRGAHPMEAGEVIVSTWEPHEQLTLEVIRDLGLELQVIFNKGAVMVLPSGVNKATGLKAALDRLGLSANNAVGVGDAENDHAFMRLCERSAAVANALESVKDDADIVLSGDHGAGVRELIDALISSDLERTRSKLHRGILLGKAGDEELFLQPYRAGTLLVSGESGGGKSTVLNGFLERLAGEGYQACIVDPEGDHEHNGNTVVLGDPKRVPSAQEVLEVLADPAKSVVANLSGVEIEERPAYFAHLMAELTKLRAQKGRPHWIALDEAHHVLPRLRHADSIVPKDVHSLIAVTVNDDTLCEDLLRTVSARIEVGGPKLGRGRARLTIGHRSTEFAPEPPTATMTRHRKKYATGELAPEKSFYFRGPEGKLNLRARNLFLFSEMANGLDDETWLHHLRRGDYAKWFRDMIGDEELAEVAESASGGDPAQSRKAIGDAIRERYTAPA